MALMAKERGDVTFLDPVRIDPVLEPIGFGFAQSLGRYLQVRDRYPDAEMMMGIGNLTELTDADSAAINVVLLGFCEELGIPYKLILHQRAPIFSPQSI